MILPILMALTFGAGPADTETLTPEAFVERIESRFQKFEEIPNLYVVLEYPATYGVKRLEYGRRVDGVFLDAEYQDWQRGRAPAQLGEDSTIRLYDNGWMKEIHRDFNGERGFIGYSRRPPEPLYNLRMMLGFGYWNSPKDAKWSLLEHERASVRVMPVQNIDDDLCVGIEVTYPVRWGDEDAESCTRLWFVPEMAMALKRHKTSQKSATRSEERMWNMSEFIELGDGFWIATHAHVKEPDREYDAKLTDWSLDPVNLADAKHRLDLKDGAQCHDSVFNQDISWKVGWSVTEMVGGKKGYGRGLLPQEFRLPSDGVESLAQTLAQAVPATFKGRCSFGFAEDLPELVQRLQELMPSSDGDAIGDDSMRKGSLGIDLAPLDKRHVVALFSMIQGYDSSDWAVLCKRARFGNKWEVVREGRKSVITADPPFRP